MEDKIQLKSGFSAVSRNLTNASSLFDDLEDILSQLDELYQDDRWAGDVHFECKYIHAAIVAYEKNIRPLCHMMERDASDLVQDADDFANNSLRVAALTW